MKSENILLNKIELLEEDLECIHLFLDKKGVPRYDKSCERYSIIGRINILLLGTEHKDIEQASKEYTSTIANMIHSNAHFFEDAYIFKKFLSMISKAFIAGAEYQQKIKQHE